MKSVAMMRGMGLALSVFLVCAVGTALGQQGESSFEFSAAPPQPAVHAGPQPRGVCADFTLTQNDDPFTLTAAGHVACLAATGPAQNGFARTYDLSAGVTSGSDVEIVCVDFAISRDGQPYSVNINIYVDTNGGGPVGPGIDLVLMGTTAVPINADGAPTFYTATFVPPVTILADSQMVVELEFPLDQSNPLCAGNACDTFPGANNLGETGVSYIRSAACGFGNFTPIANLGFPDTHYLQRVDLNLVIPATGACCADQGGGNFNCTTESLTNCQGLGGVWTVNVTCGNLMPPCGTGACCLDDTSCLDGEIEANCLANPMFRSYVFGATCAAASCPPPICQIAIPGGAIPEQLEACGPPNLNGGCNLVVPAFEMIPGCPFVGQGDIDIDAGGTRDTDWYQFTMPADGRIQFSGTAQFPLQLLVIDANAGCGGAILNTATADACQPATIVTDNLFAFGIYYLHVTVQFGMGEVNCSNTAVFGSSYFVNVDCLPVIGACQNVFECPFQCVRESPTECMNRGPNWQFLGLGIQCTPPACCPGDLNSDLQRTGADLQLYIDSFLADPDCFNNPAEFCLVNMDGNAVLDQNDIDALVDALLNNPACPTAGPVNDSCANATAIGDISLEPWDNLNATTDGPDETINCGGPVLDDVWYCYTATCTGQVTVSTCNSNFNNSVAVYTSDPNCGGCPTIAESAIACNTVGCITTDQVTTFQGVQGVKYFIRLGGNDPNAPQGTGVLTVGCS